MSEYELRRRVAFEIRQMPLIQFSTVDRRTVARCGNLDELAALLEDVKREASANREHVADLVQTGGKFVLDVIASGE